MCAQPTDPRCDPDNPVHVQLEEVLQAKELISEFVVRTPCIKSHLSKTTGIELYIKKEFLQFTGSFKDRGARNAIMKLDDEQKKAGIVVASAGNHAQGCSYNCNQLGISCTVVMPTTAAIMKIEKCKNFNATVILQGDNMTEAKQFAISLAKEKNQTYINGYDDPDILAGAGTIGLEILEDVPDVNAIICPCGGGGMLAGVCTAVKNTNPNVTIIGTESEKCPGMSKALEEGKPVATTCHPSLADGLLVPVVGYNSFETIRHYLDKMVVVKEEVIALSILALIETEKCVVEGAGACSLAAILSGVLPELIGQKVCIVLSGGNIDTSVLGRVLDRGLAVLGRLIKFSLILLDKPGGISDLLYELAKIGVSIKDIVHERAWVNSDVFSVRVTVICECRNINHAEELQEFLTHQYKDVDFTYFPNPCTAKSLGL